MGKTKRGKGTKIMAISDGNGLPLGVVVESASPAECKLVNRTIEACIVPVDGSMLIADKAYDSDGLDADVRMKYAIDMVSPHKSNRVRKRTQDGRKLRRYRKRWKIERVFAWLHNFRRVVTRWDRKAENFLSFIHLAMMKVLLNAF